MEKYSRLDTELGKPRAGSDFSGCLVLSDLSGFDHVQGYQMLCRQEKKTLILYFLSGSPLRAPHTSAHLILTTALRSCGAVFIIPNL